MEQLNTPGIPPARSGGEDDEEPTNKRKRLNSEAEEEIGRGNGGEDEGAVREDETGSGGDEDLSMEEGQISDEGSGEEGKKGKGEEDDKESVLDEVIAKAMAHFHEVEMKMQSDFRSNRRNEEYQDGFLVGGLIFSGWMPSFEMVAEAIRSIGITDVDLSPICNTSTLKLLVEIRAVRQDRVEVLGMLIRRGAQKMADFMKRSFKWRDLRWVDHWSVVLKGIPVNWSENDIKRALFLEGRFPYNNLSAIGRPATDLQGKVGGSTLLLRYATIPIAILGLHLADPNKLQIKVSKRKTLSWSFGAHPWGYDDAHRCNYCMIMHPDRLECPLEDIVRESGWGAVTESMETENMILEGDTAAIQKIQYKIEKNYNMDVEHVPVRRVPFIPATAFTGMTSSSSSSSSASATAPSQTSVSVSVSQKLSSSKTDDGGAAATTPSEPGLAPQAFVAAMESATVYDPLKYKVQRKGAWNFPPGHEGGGGRGGGTWRGGGGK
jgi:hypothetical protein